MSIVQRREARRTFRDLIPGPVRAVTVAPTRRTEVVILDGLLKGSACGTIHSVSIVLQTDTVLTRRRHT